MPVVDAVAGASCAAPHTRSDSAPGTGAVVPAAPADAVMVDVSAGGWAARISGLKRQTQELREERQRVAKELKAAQRKNKRLKERARCLFEEDMVQILVMKRTMRSAATSSEAAASSSSGAAIPAASTPDGHSSRPDMGAPTAVGTELHADDELDTGRGDA